jgi:hypothetical protein
MRVLRAVSIIALVSTPIPAFAQAQAGVAAREAAKRALPYLEKEVQCSGCKTRAVVGTVVNRDKIVRGAAAIGGPVQNETTPAYCNKENGRRVCYDSQGKRVR